MAVKAAKKSATRAKQAPAAAEKSAKGMPSPAQYLSDWRGEMLARVRKIIKEAAPRAVEEAKWRKASNPAGVPVWSQEGIICTGETYRTHVKLTFARGAALDDPAKLFNSSLEGGTRRAIDLHEGDKLNEKSLKALVRAAAVLNTSKKK